MQRELASVALIACGLLVACGEADDDAIADRGAGGASATTSSGAGGGGAQGGGGGEPFVPEPIPDVDDEVPALCADPDPNGSFQFMDDVCHAKLQPSFEDRALACPVSDDSATVTLSGGGEVVYQPSSDPPTVDATALSAIVPADMHVTLILIRRVGGVPHYRYLSNGKHEEAYQPWSTSKFIAAANAAASLRLASSDAVGLSATVDGIALGDLATSMHNYDYALYSSNSIGRYFHNIGGRARANDLIHSLWLDRPGVETFGGNYGEAAPPLGYTFVGAGNASVTISPDLSGGYSNHLSSFTTAEALKRLVLHREEPDQRLPSIQWDDVATLLYGAEGSSSYGAWGGMSADRAIYLQTGHDMDYIERRSHGRWRIFSKLGLGSGGQFLDVGYACLPVLDDVDEPVAGWGRELVIATELATGGASWAERDRLLAETYRAIIKRVVDGRL